MKNSVIKILIKQGNNKSEVEAMVEKHFDEALRCYSDPKARIIAEFIRTVY